MHHARITILAAVLAARSSWPLPAMACSSKGNDPQTIVVRAAGGPKLESVTMPQLAPPPK